VLKAIAKNPAERYPSMLALMEALDALRVETSRISKAPTIPPPPAPPVPTPIQQSAVAASADAEPRSPIWMFAVVVAAALAIVTIWWMMYR